MTEPAPDAPGTGIGDVVELTVGAVAAGGSCVARAADGRVVFVRHTLPGERVRARVTATTRSFLRADAVEVLTGSPDRVERPCPYAGPDRCGGCDWQHVALPAQRRLKAALVEEQLQRLAGVHRDVVVEEVPGAPDGLRWRTRVQLAVAPSGRAGLRKHRSHDLEPVDACLIATEDVEAVGALALRWPGASGVEVVAAGEQRVVSVTSRGAAGPGRAGPSGGRRSHARVPAVDAGTVVDGRPARGPHGVRHEVLGRRFEVAAGGFWQVHPAAARTLAETVLDGLDPRPGERALDLYAGVGLFAALLGDRVGPSGAVLAVEADTRACADAARNTDDQPHVRIRTAAVSPEVLARAGSPDLVVLDPPRSGAGLEVTRALAGLRPRRLAYVACDPASFARDLRVLLDAGWTLASLRGLDLFPMTEHVELVAVLEPPAA
ncbi:MAG: 23S rRNA (Uracil-5-) -methyltransferase RumA [uncultured Frankineae bacterium]|uniref:23S rRNA (Uracil-5-) -methyltransferase RumA n=1 Tax=uncultured Frankineae bacterium TaxID=437475 RepID=A0A6J4MIY5_9ACTN|nr:MAG: 23S rRNA (Uracil-5-) -methyltransferase RumA [uncultured Frankineae bacterium]